MNTLPHLAIKAQGGVDRWKKADSIKVDASITGAVWFIKGQVDVLKNIVIQAEIKRERLTMDLSGQIKRAIFEPDRVVVETAKGEAITARDDPKKSFEGQTSETPWDDVDVAYFSGEAMWTYLTIPFLYAQSGFETEEISPIQVEGESWRRLKVTFPENVRSHTRTEISCFGPMGF